jgi:proteasome accessory factor A
MADGRRATALEIQWSLLDLAKEYAAGHGLDPVGGAVGELALAQWEEILAGLESDPDSVADRVDWVAKRRILDAYAERHGVGPASDRLRAIDLQYHDLRPERCLADRAGLRRLVDPAAVAAAVAEPPTTTRAYFRGRCVGKYGRSVVSANWDSIVFDLGHDPLRRVPMMEPLRGTREHVGTVLDESPTAAELIRRLGS